MERIELSVVVPMHNECGNVIPLMEEIHAALDGKFAYEALFVDDGSTDGTAKDLDDAQARFPTLRVLRHRICSGQSAGIRSGVKAAQGTWIATLDGDRQNDPADIPALWEKLQEQGDLAPRTLINGHRQKRLDTFIRRLSSKVGNGVRARLLRDETPDSGCGLKLYARSLYLDMPYFNHMHRFMPALVQRDGGQTHSVRVHHRNREVGQSKYGVLNRLWVGIVDIRGVRWLQSRAAVPGVDEIVQQSANDVKETDSA